MLNKILWTLLTLQLFPTIIASSSKKDDILKISRILMKMRESQNFNGFNLAIKIKKGTQREIKEATDNIFKIAGALVPSVQVSSSQRKKSKGKLTSRLILRATRTVPLIYICCSDEFKIKKDNLKEVIKFLKTIGFSDNLPKLLLVFVIQKSDKSLSTQILNIFNYFFQKYLIDIDILVIIEVKCRKSLFKKFKSKSSNYKRSSFISMIPSRIT